MANEKRLIDANALLEIYKKWIPQLANPEDDGDRRGVETCILVLKDAPTVDAVEVVRCKDCKHWLKDFAGCSDTVGRCEWANYAVGADGYCLYGERKEC